MTAVPLQTLPALRQDLKLLPEVVDETGASQWLIFDTLQNRYHAISRRGLSILEGWRSGLPIEQFLSNLAQSGHLVTEGELDDFLTFLSKNELLEARGQAGETLLARRVLARSKPIETSLVKNYLFFRLPIAQPDEFLRKTLSVVAWTMTDWFQIMTLSVGALGLFLAGRQWETFLISFREALTFHGAVAFAITVASIKIVHELAHGYTSRYLGCRVASIGLAFIVLFPILYTDTTDTWRLHDRFQRLKVVLAGLKSELYLAAWATLVWALLPDGTLRSVAFYVATTGWISSALINLSPLLRFDGYYAFSDLLGMQNLQARGFAIGRWFLRRSIIGLPDPVPESLPPGRMRLVLIYAYVTWVYRFFVFLGIALLVYHFAFKVLGIFLFIVEIYWFIIRPILVEIAIWWRRRREARLSASRAVALLILLCLFVWATLPMPRTTIAPAVLYTKSEKVYGPVDAWVRTVNVPEGETVREGDTLLSLISPALEAERALLLREREGLDAQIAVSALRRGALPLQRERQENVESRLGQLDEALKEMTVFANQAGEVVHVLPLSKGQWVAPRDILAEVRSRDDLRIYALLENSEVSRIDTDADATFQGSWPRRVRLEDVSLSSAFTPVRRLPFVELADTHGGPMPVAQNGDGRLLKTVAMAIDIPAPEVESVELRHRMRGVLRIRTAPESLVFRWSRLLGQALWRELQI